MSETWRPVVGYEGAYEQRVPHDDRWRDQKSLTMGPQA